ncbi:hypothetical protein ACO2Q3_12545 [Caulobacter sp. KR2-114]|uniref:hypothetical protein n=1 Tax=Caulobacter sp. KR2-114 TaxID=3400912 RepID=UPI003BFC9772
MLHAFITKKVRRILGRDGHEHTNGKDEDAITSMVFTPLTFMEAGEAFAALDQLLGGALGQHSDANLPRRHTVHLWPSGLLAPSVEGDELTGCEPDLVVVFEFEVGRRLVVIGEMKWDWKMAPAALDREVAREKVAVRSRWPGEQLAFVLSKYPYRVRHRGFEALTWLDASSRLEQMEATAEQRASGRWAILVRSFLALADVVGFGGFPLEALPHLPPSIPACAFWLSPAEASAQPVGFGGFAADRIAGLSDPLKS